LRIFCQAFFKIFFIERFSILHKKAKRISRIFPKNAENTEELMMGWGKSQLAWEGFEETGRLPTICLRALIRRLFSRRVRIAMKTK